MSKFRYISLLLAIASPVFAQTYYVDAGGIGGSPSDDNPGTISSPWQTAFKAFSSAQPGDTVYFRQGTYRQIWPVSARHISKTTTAQSRIKFCGYAQETAVITSMSLCTGTSLWNKESGSVYSMAVNFAQDLNSVNHVSQDGKPLKLMTAFNQNGSAAQLTGPGQWVRDVNAQKLYVWSTLGSNPGKQNTEVGQMPFGGLGPIALVPDPCNPDSQGDYITFDHLIFEGGFSPVIIAVNGVEVKNCTIRNCSGDAIVIGGQFLDGLDDQDNPVLVSSDTKIENCNFYDYGRFAINIAGADKCFITGNSIHDNTSGTLCSAITVTNATNTVIERNEIINLSTGSAVMSFDVSGSEQNVISGIIVRNNIIRNTTAASILDIKGVAKYDFCNNLIYGSTISNSLISTAHGTKLDGSSIANTDCLIANNIFFANTSNGPLYQYRISRTAADTIQTTNNLMNASVLFNVNGWNLSLAQFVAAGSTVNTITADPAFVDVAQADFHLKSGSPCIGWGADLAGIVDDDFSGLARTKGHSDIGPYSGGSGQVAPAKFISGPSKPEILWRNSATGQIGIWYMDGVTRTSSANIQAVSDQTWQIAGKADFNGDGKPDILWRNSLTGQAGVWFMNGVTHIGGPMIKSLADQTWQIAAAADFNGDGKPDILWRNTATGQNGVWFMDGTNCIGSAMIETIGDVKWRIAGIADFNNDGKPDILWRNSATGQNGLWYMNGVNHTGGAMIETVGDTKWQIAGL